MAGKALQFDTGVVEYTVNDTATIAFNPTDASFADKFYETIQQLEAKQESLRDEAQKLEDPKEMLDFMRQRDKEMRSAIDDLFGVGISAELFPSMNCYAMANGLPVWMNLMFAVADEIAAAMSEEQKKTDPRISSYNKKYADMLAKYKKEKPSRQTHK